jgi:hypothetical protein
MVRIRGRSSLVATILWLVICLGYYDSLIIRDPHVFGVVTRPGLWLVPAVAIGVGLELKGWLHHRLGTPDNPRVRAMLWAGAALFACLWSWDQPKSMLADYARLLTGALLASQVAGAIWPELRLPRLRAARWRALTIQIGDLTYAGQWKSDGEVVRVRSERGEAASPSVLGHEIQIAEDLLADLSLGRIVAASPSLTA